MNPNDSKHAIIQIIGAIPAGRVCTYGRVAELAGLPRHARYVGTILKQLPKGSTLPWHRVINGKGQISFPAGSDRWLLQKHKLALEGIVLVNDRVPLRQFRWP